jgi:hypothetical protein
MKYEESRQQEKLESLNRGKDIPYAYSDLEKTIDEVENILEA